MICISSLYLGYQEDVDEREYYNVRIMGYKKK